MLIGKPYDIQWFYRYKTHVFPLDKCEFKKKSWKNRNQFDDSQCMFFSRFNKTCETKVFLNNFFSYIVAINISDTNKKKSFSMLTIIKLSVVIIH